MGYTSFELNREYHSHVFYKENVDFYSKFKAANKLTKKLRNLIAIYQENL